jgi:hypothetical protein
MTGARLQSKATDTSARSCTSSIVHFAPSLTEGSSDQSTEFGPIEPVSNLAFLSASCRCSKNVSSVWCERMLQNGLCDQASWVMPIALLDHMS